MTAPLSTASSKSPTSTPISVAASVAAACGSRYLETFEDRVVATAVHLGRGDERLADADHVRDQLTRYRPPDALVRGFLEAWEQVGDANWQLTEGAVAADSGTGFLLTAASYGDFDLDLEFWVTPDANSGVFIRCANPSEIGAATCYEVNIFDQRPDPTYRTGGIVEVAPPKVMLGTPGSRWPETRSNTTRS